MNGGIGGIGRGSVDNSGWFREVFADERKGWLQRPPWVLFGRTRAGTNLRTHDRRWRDTCREWPLQDILDLGVLKPPETLSFSKESVPPRGAEEEFL